MTLAFGRVVAEDGDFELAGARFGPADALLDDELAVVSGGFVEGGREFLAVVGLGDADRGAEIGGLDEDGILEGFFDLGDGFLRRFLPVGAEDGDVLDDGQAGLGEEALHHVLVHAGGGAEDAGADVGDAGQLKQALDGAVFAESAVKDREDDVERCSLRAGHGRHQGRNALVEKLRSGRSFRIAGAEAAGHSGVPSDRPVAGVRGRWIALEQLVRIGRGQPAAFPGDADGDDVEFGAVDCVEDGGGGEQRDFVLAAAATEENADAELVGHDGSLQVYEFTS